MKKYIELFFVLILVICFPLSVYAEDAEFSIKAEETTAKQGETVAVKFSIQNNPGISLFTFGIDYDKTKLTLKEINGNSLMGGSFSTNVEEDFILWMNYNGDSQFNGAVFTAIFEVAENAVIGETKVSILLPYQGGDILNYNGDEIDIQIIPGIINIQKLDLYGDTNNDGEINLLDLINLRTILSLIDISYEDNIGCDLNTDGKIDVIDLVRMKKCLVEVNTLY